MPNRIIREGILTSDRVNALSAGAEVFYRRLLSVVDDYGRFDGRIVMLKVSCFPLRVDAVREADCSRWIAECEKAGLIALYAVDGKPYLEVQDFRQAVRAKHSKYPPPSSATHMRSACVAHAPEDEDVDERRISKTEAIKGAAPASPLPPWLPAEAWERWKRHRGRKLTEQAKAMQIAKLDELRGSGHSVQGVIDLAIESGWATFYPPKGSKTQAEKRADVNAAIWGRIHEPEPIDITGQAERVA